MAEPEKPFSHEDFVRAFQALERRRRPLGMIILDEAQYLDCVIEDGPELLRDVALAFVVERLASPPIGGVDLLPDYSVADAASTWTLANLEWVVPENDAVATNLPPPPIPPRNRAERRKAARRR